MAEFWTFVLAVVNRWTTLLAGCVVTVLLGLLEKYGLKRPVSLRVYTIILSCLLFFACFQAWQIEYQGRTARETEMHRGELKITYLQGILDKVTDHSPDGSPHCLSETQIPKLVAALQSDPSVPTYANKPVYLVYRGLKSEKETRARAGCVADLVRVFIAAHWEPILHSVGDLDFGMDHEGIVFAYFTDKPLPQYVPLRKAFEKANIPHLETRMDFGFNAQSTGRPEMVYPIIYVGER